MPISPALLLLGVVAISTPFITLTVIGLTKLLDGEIEPRGQRAIDGLALLTTESNAAFFSVLMATGLT